MCTVAPLSTWPVRFRKQWRQQQATFSFCHVQNRPLLPCQAVSCTQWEQPCSRVASLTGSAAAGRSSGLNGHAPGSGALQNKQQHWLFDHGFVAFWWMSVWHWTPLPRIDCLVGLVVKTSASTAEDPGFESCLHQDFFGFESYQWLKNWHSSGYPARCLV